MVQLLAHSCRFLLVANHTNISLGCTYRWSCQTSQYIIHCLCFAIVKHSLGTVALTVVHLWAPLCKLLLDKVRRYGSLGTCQADIPAFRSVQLSAHFCRLLLVIILTNKSLDCTSSSICEHMSIWQYVSSSLQTVAWHSPQKYDCLGCQSTFNIKNFNSSLQTVPCHIPHKWASGLYRILVTVLILP